MRKNKLISLLVVMAIIVSLFTGLTISVSALTGSGTESNPYLISSAADLNAISNLNAYYKLTADITASASWSGLGSSAISSAGTSSPYETDSADGFAGTLDGDGHTITVTRTVSASGQGGVVNYLAPTGVIKNLNVEGSVTATGSVDAIGGVVGYNSGIIDNVSSSVIVTANRAYNVGGIAGFNNGYYDSDGSYSASAEAYILNSKNDGSVTGYHKVGGITGENSGTINSCHMEN